ncbi:rhamnan synthesis F family protein [Marinobacter lutaoensis]|jgi:rhamnosyltransferase|uniref:rhamnan synthesis F family protein n=1 Tax=Marinobacter lutaoensis TaxID=135739 RepID=UPI0015936A05|nr:rhamnan synthesis F family protein [Marinobacter lutaoensis]NVD35544.1 hypothetical protein [Marinobacter lutaoensis]
MNPFRKFNRYFSEAIEIRNNRKIAKVIHAETQPACHNRSKIACIFAHYCPDNKIKSYVVEMLQGIKKGGCDIVFVSSCGQNLPLSELTKLSGLTICNIIRNNIGYDFGSWKAGLDYLPDLSSQYSAILFANDSVYGPLYDLSPLLKKWLDRGPDVMSLTDSIERGYHLQTYFWGMNQKAIKSGFYRNFWYRYYGPLSDRSAVIRRYELVLAQRAKNLFGLTVGAFFPFEMVKEEAPDGDLERLNPVHHAALKLVSEKNFPFVKRELLERNPLQLENIDTLMKYLREQHPNIWSMISEA